MIHELGVLLLITWLLNSWGLFLDRWGGPKNPYVWLFLFGVLPVVVWVWTPIYLLLGLGHR